MYLKDFRVKAENRLHSDTVAIFLYNRLPNGNLSVVTNIELSEFSPSEAVSQNVALELPTLVAQQLVDTLWDCGFRPSEGTGSAGAMRKVEEHVKDMQQVSMDFRQIANRLIDVIEKHG